jgi:fatty-acyl-CoA synthase
MPPFTLTALIEEAARERPDRTAFIEEERAWTYAQFADLVGRTAAWAQARGVGVGTRVAIWLPNRIEWLVWLFACARLGATVAAVNTRFRSAELTYLLTRSKASWLVLQPGFRRIDFAGVLAGMEPGQIPDLERVAVLGEMKGRGTKVLGRPAERFALEALEPATVPDAARPDSPVVYFTTSGTTKGPKLVVHQQRTLEAHARDTARAFGFDRPGARLLAMVPFCGTYGLASALGAFAGGAPIVILDAFDAERARSLLQKHEVTHAFGGDDSFGRILDISPEPVPFPKARLFGYAVFQPGGQAVAAKAWSRGAPLFGLYGSSEVQALFSVQPKDLPLEERIKGGGRPASSAARVRARSVDTGLLLPAGEVGELEIMAPRSAFAGYLDNLEATAEATTDDGFFRTGDLGYVREDGSFVYEARAGDAMRIGGFLVAPAEIEDFLKTLPGIADAQVVAVPIEGKAQPVAFVIHAKGRKPRPDAIRTSAAEVMAAYKVPARVWQIEAFPVTESANGIKIQKGKLREMAAALIARERGS